MSNRLAYAAGRLQILVTLCLPAGRILVPCRFIQYLAP